MTGHLTNLKKILFGSCLWRTILVHTDEMKGREPTVVNGKHYALCSENATEEIRNHVDT